MNTNTELQLLNAFVDGELDLSSRLEMDERMQDDAAFARRVEELGQLREAIREGADYQRAPAALREGLAGLVAPESRRPRPVPRRRRSSRRFDAGSTGARSSRRSASWSWWRYR